MKSVFLVIIGIIVIIPAINESFAEEEILILVENNVRKVYYTGDNIISAFHEPTSATVIFETDYDAKLEIKAPQVYQNGPGLFVLKNGEEIAPETRTDNCFYYTTIETQVPETIEIIFAFWPEYPETKKGCETFTVSPLKQRQLGVATEKTQCRDSLILVSKHDDSPACVKPETKEKLLERGWAILTPKERLYDIEIILNDGDCVEFGRWLDEHADGNFNQNLLIFDLPIPYDLSQRIYSSIPDCIGDQSGFFNLNTKHIIDFEKLEKPSSKPNPIEEKYRERYDIEIVGLKDEYVLGEEYSFYFVISGYGDECARINVSYPDENGKLQGWGSEPLCDSNIIMHEFKINYYDNEETFGNIAITKSGTYTVTVMFDKPNKYFPTTISKEFQVIEK